MKRFDPVTQARIDLTAALRSAARMGLNEGVCNHFSLEMPGDSGKFLINPQGLHWSEITPADLMIVNEKGVVVEGKHAVEPTAFFIHGRIHLGKRKKCVLHTHMPFATALTLLDGGELDVYANQNAMRYYGRIAFWLAYTSSSPPSSNVSAVAKGICVCSTHFLRLPRWMRPWMKNAVGSTLCLPSTTTPFSSITIRSAGVSSDQ